jgi:predicted lipid-binding transport protein (Tim44 family)
VALPRGRSAPLGDASVPSVEDIEAKVGSHAPKDSALAQSLTALMRADPGFDPGHFLDGAKSAYEMIVTSFAAGDEETLKQLLGVEVFAARRLILISSASTRRISSRPTSGTVPLMSPSNS